MKESIKKLLLVIPIRLQEDLAPVAESEGWPTIKDLFKKTTTSFNIHWNGNYVLDQDETPWKATQEEVDSLVETSGRVVVLDGSQYSISERLTLFADRDGSVYVIEEDLKLVMGGV